MKWIWKNPSQALVSDSGCVIAVQQDNNVGLHEAHQFDHKNFNSRHRGLCYFFYTNNNHPCYLVLLPRGGDAIAAVPYYLELINICFYSSYCAVTV